MKKRKSKKSILKKLLTRCENLWKLRVRERDKNECQLATVFPHVCSPVLQVDHAFSRKVKRLFLDPRNGTTICKAMHTLKTYCINGAEKAVDEFVRLREGDVFWKYAMSAAQSKKPYKLTILELEKIEKELEKNPPRPS